MSIFKNIKDSFSLNNISGSITQVKKTASTIESLMSLLQDNKVSTSVREMIKGLGILIKDQPNLTSINHFLNHFLLKLDPENQPIVLKELLEVYQDRWKNVERKTAHQIYQHFDFEDKTVLIHGNDKAIQALIELCAVNHKKIKIIQSLTKQDQYGKEQVRILINHDLPIKVVDDANLGQFYKEIDVIILAADIITNDSFLCKTGAHNLCLAGLYYNKPVFALSDSRKILNKKYFTPSIIETFIGETKKQPNEIWKGAPNGVVIVNNYTEIIQNELVTAFVLENKIIDAASITQEVDKILVSKFF
jgi:translation initiation factor 2B subunit (eIF-2B alpha/beta/delta family)